MKHKPVGTVLGSTRGRQQRKTSQKNKAKRASGVVVGTLAGLEGAGLPLVNFPGNDDGLLPALSVVHLSKKAIGQQVILQFEAGDPRRPVILGLVQKPGQKSPGETRSIVAKVDGEQLTIAATEEIVLQCGKASITLTHEGKVAIRGTYVLSRSSGVNRIQGGSIELN